MSTLGKIGAFAGGGVTGLKIHATRTRGRTQGRLIRAAYERAQGNLGRQQQDIRQGTTESLNAHGILNGGSGSVAPAGSDRFQSEGRIGETGAANTLGGQVQRDLSSEFAREREDLWTQRQTAIKQNKADTMQGYVNDVTSTAQAAAGFMTGNPMAAASLLPQQRSTGAAGSGQVDPSMTLPPIGAGGIRGAFGLSPVDGSGTPVIGVAQPGMPSFNFHL